MVLNSGIRNGKGNNEAIYQENKNIPRKIQQRYWELS